MKKLYEYTPYGQVQKKEGSISFTNEALYTGHVKDKNTGFYYMNARYYEPETAQFLTPDSYTGNPYNPNTQNVYSYTGGNPVNYVDPTGHFAVAAALGVGIVGVIGQVLIAAAVVVLGVILCREQRGQKVKAVCCAGSIIRRYLSMMKIATNTCNDRVMFLL